MSGALPIRRKTQTINALIFIADDQLLIAIYLQTERFFYETHATLPVSRLIATDLHIHSVGCLSFSQSEDKPGHDIYIYPKKRLFDWKI